jgi:hypothetical protein
MLFIYIKCFHFCVPLCRLLQRKAIVDAKHWPKRIQHFRSAVFLFLFTFLISGFVYILILFFVHVSQFCEEQECGTLSGSCGARPARFFQPTVLALSLPFSHIYISIPHICVSYSTLVYVLADREKTEGNSER